MGMFDSMYDAQGIEWQTKAYDRNLDQFDIGDTLPVSEGCTWPVLPAYQVKVLGGGHGEDAVDSYATVRSGDLTAVPDERDEQLPLLDYFGGWLVAPEEV